MADDTNSSPGRGSGKAAAKGAAALITTTAKTIAALNSLRKGGKK